MSARTTLCLVAAVASAGCGKGEMQQLTPPPWVHPLLSQWNLFQGALGDQKPADGVTPYEVISVLYADDAGKQRFVVLPPGGRIGFDPTARWTWPEGAMLVKTFYYPLDGRKPDGPRRILETRLLILHDGAWTTHTYVWNDAQTDAQWYVAGQTLQIARSDASGAMVSGEYRVPSTAQCKTCHGQPDAMVPLGLRTRQLNRTHDYGKGPENQLTHFASLAMFEGTLPDPAKLDALADPHGNAPVERRARAYLDANCAHCHNHDGYAASTALRLNLESNLPVDLGVCRHPVAAGRAAGDFLYDIVPGQPDMSILIYRMKSNDPQIKMPQLPLTTSDIFGVGLVSQWIAGMTPPGCP